MYGGVFGGDKDIVTLDGCSAGSASGWHHMIQPLSWPFFRILGLNVDQSACFIFWYLSKQSNHIVSNSAIFNSRLNKNRKGCKTGDDHGIHSHRDRHLRRSGDRVKGLD